MRWKTVVTGLALAVAAAVGCKQRCYLTECDFHHYHELMPPSLEVDPFASIIPAGSNTPAPATVVDPERTPRHLSLAEAKAMSLERGSIGSPTLNGTANLNLPSFAGRNVFTSESNIRVLALDPAIVGTDIEASLSKFDARWNTNMTWQTTDLPTGGNFIQSFQNGTNSQFQTSVTKPLPTGGVANITFQVQHTFLNEPPPDILNPVYRPRLQFAFEQPLLQGYGVEINQLRTTHPGSIVNPFPTGGRVEGILIARLRFDQQRAEFERNVHIMLVNVEVAYWNLYGSYWNLYSREQALRQAFEAWKINKERYEAGRIAVTDFAQTRGQYELFRAQRIQALAQVLENERALRILIGLPVEDGTQIIPIDAPTITPYKPDWQTALQESLALRPELIIAREDVKFRQLDLINQKNLLLPDLRLATNYGINAIGTELDGGRNNPDNAFASLASGDFTDWQIQLRMDVPLGFRDAHAGVRAAKLNLARSWNVLKDQENRAEQFLALQFANIVQFYELIGAQRSQREAAAQQLDARFREFLNGRGTLDFLLEAQRVWADALRDEFNAIVQYNNAIITFEFAKGTIMQHDNVVIAEGLLPHCAQVRAVDHEQERSKALLLIERARPIIPPACEHNGHSYTGVPQLPEFRAPSVPAIQEGQSGLPPLPAPEALPLPRETPPPAQAPVQEISYTAPQSTQPQAAPTRPASKPASLGEPQVGNPAPTPDIYRYRPQGLR
jgi:outer membrane protein TolC